MLQDRETLPLDVNQLCQGHKHVLGIQGQGSKKLHCMLDSTFESFEAAKGLVQAMILLSLGLAWS
jgi:hypothetical protein